MQVVGYHRIATGRWLAVLGLVSLVSKEETAWSNDATIKHSLTTRLSSVGIVPSLLIVRTYITDTTTRRNNSCGREHNRLSLAMISS